MNKITEIDIAAEYCYEDFFRSLSAATKEAGGSVGILDELVTLEQVASRLARNGIRFHYDPSKVCTAVPSQIILNKAMEKLNSQRV
jgi:hypothetical protein